MTTIVLSESVEEEPLVMLDPPRLFNFVEHAVFRGSTAEEEKSVYSAFSVRYACATANCRGAVLVPGQVIPIWKRGEGKVPRWDVVTNVHLVRWLAPVFAGHILMVNCAWKDQNFVVNQEEPFDSTGKPMQAPGGRVVVEPSLAHIPCGVPLQKTISNDSSRLTSRMSPESWLTRFRDSMVHPTRRSPGWRLVAMSPSEGPDMMFDPLHGAMMSTTTLPIPLGFQTEQELLQDVMEDLEPGEKQEALLTGIMQLLGSMHVSVVGLAWNEDEGVTEPCCHDVVTQERANYDLVYCSEVDEGYSESSVELDQAAGIMAFQHGGFDPSLL
jgi:hypothetical protein